MYITDFELVDYSTYAVTVEDADGNEYLVHIESDRTEAGIEYTVDGNHPFDDQDLVNDFIKIFEREQRD